MAELVSGSGQQEQHQAIQDDASSIGSDRPAPCGRSPRRRPRVSAALGAAAAAATAPEVMVLAAPAPPAPPPPAAAAATAAHAAHAAGRPKKKAVRKGCQAKAARQRRLRVLADSLQSLLQRIRQLAESAPAAAAQMAARPELRLVHAKHGTSKLREVWDEYLLLQALVQIVRGLELHDDVNRLLEMGARRSRYLPEYLTAACPIAVQAVQETQQDLQADLASGNLVDVEIDQRAATCSKVARLVDHLCWVHKVVMQGGPQQLAPPPEVQQLCGAGVLHYSMRSCCVYFIREHHVGW